MWIFVSIREVLRTVPMLVHGGVGLLLNHCFFYPFAIFQKTRQKLSVVLGKVRYLRAVDMYHWDLFVGMLRLQLADSATMVVFLLLMVVYR